MSAALERASQRPDGLAARRITLATSDLGGGTGNHVLQWLAHLDASRLAVEIVAEAQRSARSATPVPVTSIASWGRFDRYPLAQLRRMRIVEAELARRSSDLLHCYFYWPIRIGRALKRAGRVPLLIENREDQGFAWGPAEYRALRRTRALPDRVICVSEAVRRVVLEREGLAPERTLVIPNGIEASAPCRDRSLKAELGLPPEARVVGLVANLNRAVKGVDVFLRAVPLVLRRAPEVHFAIFGRGALEAELRQLAAELGVSARVHFAGYRSDVERCYAIMDVSACTSHSEGLSITLLESMRQGLPIVATAVGGNPEVVAAGETGFLVPPREPEVFAQRVAELLDDAELRARFGEAARRRIAEHFDLRRTARRYADLYTDLCASRESR